MKQLSFGFDDASVCEEESRAGDQSPLSTEDLDRARRAARMMAVLECFPPLPPNLSPAKRMEEKGWLRRYLFSTEAYFFARWPFWLKALVTRRVPSVPIPKISFRSDLPNYFEGCWSASLSQHPGLKMLVDTMNFPHSYGMDLRDKVLRFVDWFLVSVASSRGEGLVKVDSEEADWYYRKFQIQRLYEYPADYMSCFSVAIAGGRGNRLGHFPTPGALARCIVEMTLSGEEERMKTASVLDPAAGTGILLLHASNFSLNLHTIDVSPTMCQLIEWQSWAFIPWLVFPAEFHADGTLTRADSARIVTRNALE